MLFGAYFQNILTLCDAQYTMHQISGAQGCDADAHEAERGMVFHSDNGSPLKREYDNERWWLLINVI